MTKEIKEKLKKLKKYYQPMSIILAAVLLITLTTALWHLLISSPHNSEIQPPPVEKTKTPVYEEAYSVTSKFIQNIRKTDSLIYKSLYDNGLTEKDITFTSVEPKHMDKYEWEFSELLIKAPEQELIVKILETISLELSKLKPTIKYAIKSSSEDEIHIYIKIMDQYTHKINIIAIKEEVPDINQNLPLIAIIIDDMGLDRRLANSLTDLDIPICFAMLPDLPYTKRIAHTAMENGVELLLHLPMEPKNYPEVNPGDLALLINMEEDEIISYTNKMIKMVPGIVGVNNHMGSRFTENEEKTAIVLNEIKKHNLFFIDSRTATKSIAYKLSKEKGIQTNGRDIFLDNNTTIQEIKIQMEKLLSYARSTGSGIGIGHPYKETYQVIKEYVPKLQSEFRVVPVSKLVK